MPHTTSRRTASALLVLALGLGTAPPLLGQNANEIRRDIQESQLRLEEVRSERARLQGEMADLRGRVQNISSELRNIERQLSASRSVLAEIDFQVEANTAQLQQTTRDLVRTQDRLRERNAILNRRLRDIFKRGTLHHVRVLLGADSFADLLNRYRYLQLIATYDRALVDNVSALEGELRDQNQEMRENLLELERLRQFQVGEVAELRQVEVEHQRTLQTFRSRESQTTSRLVRLEEDEQRLRGLVDDLERRRLEAERRQAVAGGPGGIAGPASLSAADAGVLDWPVEGPILYRFGREQRPNGTVLRWNGLGIGAAPGTPVQAVRSGTVVLAGPFEGYGPTVVVSHGDGYYTLYLYLDEVGVVEGRTIGAGQVVGTVGGRGTPEGPRLEFQIRAPVAGSPPQAMDPLQWLRPRAGSP